MKLKMYLLILSLAILVHLGNTLSCGPCCHDQETMRIEMGCIPCGPPPMDCQLVKDVCGCCDVCAKTEGEECGGPWNITGICADGLTCANPDHDPSISSMMNTPGVCRGPDDWCCKSLTSRISH